MDIDIFEEKFGNYFRDKRRLYVIKPGTIKKASNINTVQQEQKDAGKEFSKKLQVTHPLYKIGLVGKPGSSTGILGSL